MFGSLALRKRRLLRQIREVESAQVQRAMGTGLALVLFITALLAVFWGVDVLVVPAVLFLAGVFAAAVSEARSPRGRAFLRGVRRSYGGSLGPLGGKRAVLYLAFAIAMVVATLVVLR
jgi:hypothetical protein